MQRHVPSGSKTSRRSRWCPLFPRTRAPPTQHGVRCDADLTAVSPLRERTRASPLQLTAELGPRWMARWKAALDGRRPRVTIRVQPHHYPFFTPAPAPAARTSTNPLNTSTRRSSLTSLTGSTQPVTRVLPLTCASLRRGHTAQYSCESVKSAWLAAAPSHAPLCSDEPVFGRGLGGTDPSTRASTSSAPTVTHRASKTNLMRKQYDRLRRRSPLRLPPARDHPRCQHLLWWRVNTN